MTTYANIKLSEIFALYGNPFTRGSYKKNAIEKIFQKFYKKINFEEKIKFKEKEYNEGNSKLSLLKENINNFSLIKNSFYEKRNQNKSLIRLGHFFPNNGSNKFSSKLNVNTEAFSVSLHKKSRQELRVKIVDNLKSEDINDYTKISYAVLRKNN